MELPQQMYWVTGALVLANLGTIGSVIWFSFKGVWWLSKLDSKVEKNSEDIAKHSKEIDDLNMAVINCRR